MREPFRRRIVEGYPAHKFETDISANFPDHALVTVTLENLDGIVPGDTIIETHFRFAGGKLVKTAEKSVAHQ